MGEITLQDALARAPHEIRVALEWFHERAGQEIGWPSPSPVDTLEHVVTSAKGIYKPAGFDVALSVRQVLGGPYADKEIVDRDSGGWVYAYHQERHDPAERDLDARNRALMQNIATGSPVAVLIQTKRKPPVRYRVQGLAVVTGWSDGFFYLEGFDADERATRSVAISEDAVLDFEAAELVLDPAAVGSTAPDHDARRRVRATVVARRGQPAFRQTLLHAYGGRCAVTGCDVEAVLEAAHIVPYRGDHTNHVTNGLLLRADVHTLMDSGLFAIDPVERRGIVAAQLAGSEYETLSGSPLREPVDPTDRPHAENLHAHLEWCGDRLS